jgi:hypothetical protein
MPSKSLDALEPLDEFHGAAGVNVHEDADVRCREGRLDHGLRGCLADPLDRDPLDALVLGLSGLAPKSVGLVQFGVPLRLVADQVLAGHFTA